MKVGIYTIHADVNYGAMLQAYATQKFLCNNGIDAEIVNVFDLDAEARLRYKIRCDSIKNIFKRIMSFLPKTRKKIIRLHEFHDTMRLSKRYYSLDEVYNHPPVYDIHLVGSDQLWNLQNGFNKRNFFFLDFLDKNQKKVSYAPSMGNTNIYAGLYPKLKELLNTFTAISTREKDAADLLSSITGRKVAHVVDPTLLLSAADWMRESSTDPIVKGNYILYYGFDKSQLNKAMINELKSQLGMPVIAISVNLTVPYSIDKLIRDAGPREFLNLFRFASYVITSSFHGMAFAIIFRRNFFVMTHGNSMARMESLLDSFGIENRIVSSRDELSNIYRVCPYVNYQSCDVLIKKQISLSQQWLLNTINNNTID